MNFIYFVKQKLSYVYYFYKRQPKIPTIIYILDSTQEHREIWYWKKSFDLQNKMEYSNFRHQENCTSNNDALPKFFVNNWNVVHWRFRYYRQYPFIHQYLHLFAIKGEVFDSNYAYAITINKEYHRLFLINN